MSRRHRISSNSQESFNDEEQYPSLQPSAFEEGSQGSRNVPSGRSFASLFRNSPLGVDTNNRVQEQYGGSNQVGAALTPAQCEAISECQESSFPALPQSNHASQLSQYLHTSGIHPSQQGNQECATGQQQRTPWGSGAMMNLSGSRTSNNAGRNFTGSIHSAASGNQQYAAGQQNASFSDDAMNSWNTGPSVPIRHQHIAASGVQFSPAPSTTTVISEIGALQSRSGHQKLAPGQQHMPSSNAAMKFTPSVNPSGSQDQQHANGQQKVSSDASTISSSSSAHSSGSQQAAGYYLPLKNAVTNVTWSIQPPPGCENHHYASGHQSIPIMSTAMGSSSLTSSTPGNPYYTPAAQQEIPSNSNDGVGTSSFPGSGNPEDAVHQKYTPSSYGAMASRLAGLLASENQHKHFMKKIEVQNETSYPAAIPAWANISFTGATAGSLTNLSEPTSFSNTYQGLAEGWHSTNQNEATSPGFAHQSCAQEVINNQGNGNTASRMSASREEGQQETQQVTNDSAAINEAGTMDESYVARHLANLQQYLKERAVKSASPEQRPSSNHASSGHCEGRRLQHRIISEFPSEQGHTRRQLVNYSSSEEGDFEDSCVMDLENYTGSQREAAILIMENPSNETGFSNSALNNGLTSAVPQNPLHQLTASQASTPAPFDRTVRRPLMPPGSNATKVCDEQLLLNNHGGIANSQSPPMSPVHENQSDDDVYMRSPSPPLRTREMSYSPTGSDQSSEHVSSVTQQVMHDLGLRDTNQQQPSVRVMLNEQHIRPPLYPCWPIYTQAPSAVYEQRYFPSESGQYYHEGSYLSVGPTSIRPEFRFHEYPSVLKGSQLEPTVKPASTTLNMAQTFHAMGNWSPLSSPSEVPPRRDRPQDNNVHEPPSPGSLNETAAGPYSTSMLPQLSHIGRLSNRSELLLEAEPTLNQQTPPRERTDNPAGEASALDGSTAELDSPQETEKRQLRNFVLTCTRLGLKQARMALINPNFPNTGSEKQVGGQRLPADSSIPSSLQHENQPHHKEDLFRIEDWVQLQKNAKERREKEAAEYQMMKVHNRIALAEFREAVKKLFSSEQLRRPESDSGQATAQQPSTTSSGKGKDSEGQVLTTKGQLQQPDVKQERDKAELLPSPDYPPMVLQLWMSLFPEDNVCHPKELVQHRVPEEIKAQMREGASKEELTDRFNMELSDTLEISDNGFASQTSAEESSSQITTAGSDNSSNSVENLVEEEPESSKTAKEGERLNLPQPEEEFRQNSLSVTDLLKKTQVYQDAEKFYLEHKEMFDRMYGLSPGKESMGGNRPKTTLAASDDSSIAFTPLQLSQGNSSDDSLTYIQQSEDGPAAELEKTCNHRAELQQLSKELKSAANYEMKEQLKFQLALVKTAYKTLNAAKKKTMGSFNNYSTTTKEKTEYSDHGLMASENSLDHAERDLVRIIEGNRRIHVEFLAREEERQDLQFFRDMVDLHSCVFIEDPVFPGGFPCVWFFPRMNTMPIAFEANSSNKSEVTVALWKAIKDDMKQMRAEKRRGQQRRKITFENKPHAYKIFTQQGWYRPPPTWISPALILEEEFRHHVKERRKENAKTQTPQPLQQ